MFTFLVLTSLEGYLPDPAWYPMAYATKVALVALVTWLYRETWRDLRPLPSALGLVLAIVTGLVVFALWVGLDPLLSGAHFSGKANGARPCHALAGLEMAVHHHSLRGSRAARPPDRRAVLAVVPDPLADQPRLHESADRRGHPDGGGSHLGCLCAWRIPSGYPRS